MTCELSEFLSTGNVSIVINIDRITSIKDCYVTGQHYIDVQLAEDHILASYETPYACAQAIHSGLIFTGQA